MKEVLFDAQKYPDFVKENTGVGLLKIQVFTANQAFPLEGVNIVISKVIDGDKVIFFTGVTDSSGIIDNINLPTKASKADVLSPEDIIYTNYDVSAEYSKNNAVQDYTVAVFDNIKVIQPIKFATVGGDMSE